MASKIIQPLGGTRDFYPDDMRFRNWMFNIMRQVSERYGYEEYDGPFLEPYELYAAKSGEELVNENMYSFDSRPDRNGETERLAIRPEMTPTLARMVAVKQRELRKPIRWYTIPNLYRHETQQRGRKREFFQYNVDILGVESLEADAEIVAVVADLLNALGLKDKFVIRVNNRQWVDEQLAQLGIAADLKDKVYREIDGMEKVTPEKFRANLLEAGVPAASVGALQEVLTDRDFSGFAPLEQLWEKVGQYGYADTLQFDPSIVRGLAYYTGTVFEVWDVNRRFNRAIMGGGRYENLVGAVGGQPLTGVGIAAGDAPLEEFLKAYDLMPNLPRLLDIFVATYSPAERAKAIEISAMLREVGLKVETNLLDSKLDKQLKTALDSNARYLIVVAPGELERGEVSLKNLQTREQSDIPVAELAQRLGNA